jgi:hypothetical protein
MKAYIRHAVRQVKFDVSYMICRRSVGAVVPETPPPIPSEVDLSHLGYEEVGDGASLRNLQERVEALRDLMVGDVTGGERVMLVNFNRMLSPVLGIAGAVTLALATLGIYGVVAVSGEPA